MAKTILIVEDDPNISELVQMYLEKEGYHTKIAADGGQGVALFRQAAAGSGAARYHAARDGRLERAAHHPAGQPDPRHHAHRQGRDERQGRRA